MRRDVKLCLSIGGSIRIENLLGLTEYAINLVFGQDNSHHRQLAPEIGFDHGPNAVARWATVTNC